MMHGCNKCNKMGAVLLLAIGIAFLLQDLGSWNFWGLSWYTVLFLFLGVTCFSCAKCKDCQNMAKKK